MEAGLARKQDNDPDKEKEPRPAGVQIDTSTGRRIDLRKLRANRAAASKKRKEPKPPIEDDRVARIWDRMEHRAGVQEQSFSAMERVVKPRRNAADLIDKRVDDSPTPERLVRAGKDYEVSDHGTMHLKDQPLDRLYKPNDPKRSPLNKRQFEAGDRLRQDFVVGGLRPLAASDPASAGGRGSPESKWVPGFMPAGISQAAARQRWRDAEKALGDRLWPVVQVVVIDPLQPEATEIRGDYLVVVGRRLTGRGQAGEARASLIELLKVALDVLADHYRLPDDTRDQGGRRRGHFYRSFGNMGPEE